METLKRAILILVWVLAAATVHAARVEFEAEDVAECNVEIEAPGPPQDTRSGGAGLALDSDTAIVLSYRFRVPEGAKYTLRVREFWPNSRSTLRWRVDDGAWTVVKQPWGLMTTSRADALGYTDWGDAEMAAGRHALHVETVSPQMKRKQSADGKEWRAVDDVLQQEQHRLNLDVFVFTTERLVPSMETARIYKKTGRYQPYEPKNAEDWYEVPVELDDFSDSVLDLLRPAPGAIGDSPEACLRRNGDGFEYADGRPFRLWGLSGPTAPPRHDAEYYACRARRLGITAVRLHSLDGGLCDRHSGRSYDLDETRLDRMEYFIHCLKEQGIYVVIDPLYNWQWDMLGEPDGLPADAVLKSRVKTPFYFDPELQRRNRDFIKAILTHRNPYTGLVNGEDPAIAFFHVINENTIFWNAGMGGPEAAHWRQMLAARFNRWLAARYGTREKLAAAWGESLSENGDPERGTVGMLGVFGIANAGRKPELHARARDETEFLFDTQAAFYNSVRDYVHEDLGFDHILFNGSGWWGVGWLDSVDTAANLPGMDFFDQHGYGPVRSGVLAPKQVGGRPSLVERFASKTPAGYPSNVSEWNNGNKVCGPLTMACYGALQGWDGLFQYHTNFSFDGLRGTFAPVAQAYLQYPVASMAFTRRLVREADVAWRYVTPHDRLFDPTRTEDAHRTPLAGLHSLIGKCEWVFGGVNGTDDAAPVTVDTTPFLRGNGAFVDSMTGELTYARATGLLHVKAPQLQGLVGVTDDAPAELGDVTMALQNTGELSVSLVALDGKPLAESRRMLLCAVGETKGAEESDDPAERREVRRGNGPKPLTFPLVMRPPVGEITFARPVKAVYALDLSGKRKAELALRDGRTIRLDNTHRTPWFEVVR